MKAFIEEWNKSGKADNKVTIRTLWFYPWKYHDKDDVWRGLISEVISKGTEIKGANVKRVTKAAKQVGIFSGNALKHVFPALKLKIGGGKIPVEVELDLSRIKDILDEYDKNIHPEKAFLNEFENSFKRWLSGTLGKNERMVIFIDDLDRCMPQVALGVLEALKLYLNIEKLIFVMGVDKDVIKPLVGKQYKDLGLNEDKSDNYLAKMFQTEVTVGPSEDQVMKYLDHHLASVEYFNDSYLEPFEKQLFRNLINDLAKRNPREVKRLINSAIMSGAGIEMLKKAGDDRSDYSFKQGMQVFFIRTILEEYKGDIPRLLGGKSGNAFFSEWSQIVCANIKEDENFPLTINIPKDYQQILLKYRDIKDGSRDEVLEQMKKRALTESPPDIPMEYYQFIKTPEYSDLLPLLSDKRLGQLMRIEFSAEIAEITKEAEPTTKKEDDTTIICNAIAERLNKNPDKLTEEDYDSVTELSLYGKKITDITLLKQCKDLNDLNLSNTGISDISMLSGLTKLMMLWLGSNQISDISALKGMANLTELSLAENQISDISVIKELTNLTQLHLYNNQISDISALKGMAKLTKLSLGENQINDISVIKELTNLTQLNLYHNQISDISVINGLTKLVKLHLIGNQVSDISPISDLTSLTELYLSRTNIIDVKPLKDLTELILLDLNNTEVNDLTPIKGLNKLTHLYASTTQLDNIKVISELTNLRVLGITKTKVSDLTLIKQLNHLNCFYFSDTPVKTLEPLRGHKTLILLSFGNTEIDTLEPLQKLTNLQTLKIQNTPINSLEPLKGLGNLQSLNIAGCEKITNRQVDDLQKALPKLKIIR